MNRRSLLATVGTITAGVAGCLGLTTTDDTDGNSDIEWQHELVSNSLTVSNDRVYGVELTLDGEADTKIDGGLFALDLATGERQWTYGTSHGGHPGLRYSVTENGIYASQTDDQPYTPGSITALDFDGTIRWGNISGWFADAVADTAFITVPGPSHEEELYDFDLSAFDAATGEQLWTSTYGGTVKFDMGASALPKTAYVNEDTLAAIDTTDGSVNWSYGDEEDSFLLRAVSNGVVYSQVNWGESVIAVSEGEALWTIDSMQPNIEEIASGHVLVSDRSSDSQFPIYAFDMETGEKQWVEEDIRQGNYRTPVSVSDDRIYIGEQDRISAFAVADGTEAWNIQIESDDLVRMLEVVPENGGGDYAIFTYIEHSDTDHSLRRINTNGEVTWTWSTDERLHDFVGGELILVATESGISAFNPS